MQYKSLQSHQWFWLVRSLPHEGRWRSLALRFFVIQGYPERWDTSESVWTKFLPLSYSKSNLLRSQKFRFPKHKINSSGKLFQSDKSRRGRKTQLHLVLQLWKPLQRLSKVCFTWKTGAELRQRPSYHEERAQSNHW